MSLEQKLEEAKAKRKEIVDRVNALADQSQALLEEALRFDGEVRALEALVKEEKKE